MTGGVEIGPPSPRVRRAAVVVVLLVAAVAALMSYGHLRAVAASQGENAAAVFPLSVDGLIVAASLVLLVRRRSGQAGGSLAWTGLLLGVAATIAGNIASAEPTILARLVAAWPPVAFALSYELLLSLLRPTLPAQQRAPKPRPDSPDLSADEPAAPTPLEERAQAALAAADGRPPGRRALARQLGCSEHQARTLLDAITSRATRTTEGSDPA